MKEPTPASGDDIPVLIVGGGPVGLAMAAELGWRGIRCMLVEKGDGTVVHPKTNGVNMRTMEFCRRWGIAGQIRKLGYPRERPHDHIYFTTLAGFLIHRHSQPPLDEVTPPPGALEPFQRCPQTVFDPVLRGYVETLPSVTLRYHIRCDGLDQDPDGVDVRLTDLARNTSETVRATYVVACEGARSPIRDALGIRLHGTPALAYSTNVLFRSEEFATFHDKGEGRSYIAIGPEGRWASVNAINGTDLWRFQVRGSLDPASWGKVDIDADLLRFAGRPFRYEVLSVLEWVRRALIADSYQSGRVFLAGDAVHQLTPSGSFGMNTGIGDITNLSWKLEAALQGWAGQALLDTYTSERLPVGKRNVDEAAARFRLGDMKRPPSPAIMESGPEGEALRRRTAERIAREMQQPPSFGLQIGYRYDTSPLNWDDGTPVPPPERESYTATTRPGARAPDARLPDDRPLLDLYGRGFVLVRLGRDAPSGEDFQQAAAARGVPLQSVVVTEPEIQRLYERRLVLVRPDGHVAWRDDSPPINPIAVIDRIRGAA